MKDVLPIGARFGRLIVIGVGERRRVIANRRKGTFNSYATSVCRCDCGKEKTVQNYLLRTGRTLSCGCYSLEVHSKIKRKHGCKGTRLYKIWQGMKSRCYYLKAINYSNYGGRGIRVCNEWRIDFSVFRKWAIANGYSEDKTLDRINSNGNYEPGNCRWATIKTQCENRRSSVMITAFGETMCLLDWSRRTGISRYIIHDRIFKKGISPEKALGLER